MAKTETTAVDVKASPAQEKVPETSILVTDRQRQSLAQVYRAEPKVPVTISPFYANHLGRTATVSVQGIAVYIPCDGRTYDIPATHAGVLYEAIAAIDAQNRKKERMGSIKSNVEGSIGELVF